MNKIRTIKCIEFSSRTLALLLTLLLVMTVSNASAKGHKPRGYDAESHVVAHISFSGLSAIDMAMQRKVNDKYYLYVEHSKDQGVSIIDISKPTQPKAVAVIPWPDPELSSRMSLTAIWRSLPRPRFSRCTGVPPLTTWYFGICRIQSLLE